MGRAIQIDIDCAEPEALAAFWAQALDYRLADPPAGRSKESRRLRMDFSAGRRSPRR